MIGWTKYIFMIWTNQEWCQIASSAEGVKQGDDASVEHGKTESGHLWSNVIVSLVFV